MENDSEILGNLICKFVNKIREDVGIEINKICKDNMDLINNCLFNIFKSNAKLIESEMLELIQALAPLVKHIKEINKAMPIYVKDVSLILGNRGWYIDVWGMDVVFFNNVYNMILTKNVSVVDKSMEDYFEEKLDKIEKIIVTQYPKRKEIMVAAFNAHRRNEYILSIPVFLSQIDGICYENTDKYLFIKNGNKPQTASYVSQFAKDVFWAAILTPLNEQLPINYSKEKRGINFKGLNRHLVLHGESLNYGTKTNSLKAISLLNYIIRLFPR